MMHDDQFKLGGFKLKFEINLHIILINVEIL